MINDMDYEELCGLADDLEEIIAAFEKAERLDIASAYEARAWLVDVNEQLSAMEEAERAALNRQYMREALA